MSNDRLECAPLAYAVLFRATIEEQSRRAVILKALPVLLVQLEDLKA